MDLQQQPSVSPATPGLKRDLHAWVFMPGELFGCCFQADRVCHWTVTMKMVIVAMPLGTTLIATVCKSAPPPKSRSCFVVLRQVIPHSLTVSPSEAVRVKMRKIFSICGCRSTREDRRGLLPSPTVFRSCFQGPHHASREVIPVCWLFCPLQSTSVGEGRWAGTILPFSYIYVKVFCKTIVLL